MEDSDKAIEAATVQHTVGETCWFCSKKASVQGAAHTVSMRITLEKTETYGPRNIVTEKYKDAHIKVPRCDDCKQIHNMNEDFSLLPNLWAVLFTGLFGCGVGYLSYGSGMSMIFGTVVGAFLGALTSLVANFSLARSRAMKAAEAVGIKYSADCDDYPAIASRLKDGWRRMSFE